MCFSGQSSAQDYTISSPDKKIKISIIVKDAVQFQVNYLNDEILSASKISLELADNKKLGVDSKIKNVSTRQVKQILKPVIREKFNEIKEEFNEIRLDFDNNYSLEFRAYNEGVAYRFVMQIKDDVTIKMENIRLNFTEKDSIYFQRSQSFTSAYETPYAHGRVIKHADYIAKTNGNRTYPWRIFAIANEAKDLITNQLVYMLASPLELENTAWIQPGVVIFDWWARKNIYNVDFKAGVNTATMNNAQLKDFRNNGNFPMGLGTRAHAMALFVVLESPMQMLPDSPSDYYRERECMEFIKDGINADLRAIDYKKETRSVSSSSTMHIELAPGGGWLARIFKK